MLFVFNMRPELLHEAKSCFSQGEEKPALGHSYLGNHIQEGPTRQTTDLFAVNGRNQKQLNLGE